MVPSPPGQEKNFLDSLLTGDPGTEAGSHRGAAAGCGSGVQGWSRVEMRVKEMKGPISEWAA